MREAALPPPNPPHLFSRRCFKLALVCLWSCIVQGLYDVGNIAAVFRSAEAFGVEHMYLINKHGDRFKKAKTVSVGAEKWLTLHHFHDTIECYEHLKQMGYHIAGEQARLLRQGDDSKTMVWLTASLSAPCCCILHTSSSPPPHRKPPSGITVCPLLLHVTHVIIITASPQTT